MKKGAPQTQSLIAASEVSLENLSSVWLDNQQVLEKLHISKRTLQNLRSKNVIPYSKVGKKCFYNKTHVQEMMFRHFKGR